MAMKKNEITDYRKFRFSKLNTPEFSHLKYLIFWPIYGIVFSVLERGWIRDYYYPMHCALDDYIPFCEYFLIPYMFWFVFLVGMILYTLLFDTGSFRKLMQFIILTYTTTIVIYILFPNCQELRPVTFERDNIFTQFMASFYEFDTNTNVCPSLHVIGSLAVMFSSWHSKHFSSLPWQIAFTGTAVLISVSTVFLKQHSAIDVLGAVPICIAAYILGNL